MVNLTPYQSYSTLFNSLKQLPQLDTPGLSNIAGAFMAAKYGRSINSALSTNLNSVIKSFRNNATSLNKQAKDLTALAGQSALKDKDGAVTGTTGKQTKLNNTIRIDQLAAKQTNQSTLLDAKQSTALAPGSRNLTIASGNKSFTVAVSIKAGDSNSAVLSKTAKGINDAGASVKARVAADSLGNQQLIVEAEKTGKNNGFTIGGELGDALGLSQVVQAGANAKFNYNGTDYETDSNTVTLDAGKTKLELKNTTDGTVALNRSAETSGLAEKVGKLATAYNQFQETLADNPDNKALQAVSRQMDQMVTRNANALSEFGVTKNARGQLEIDTEKLEAAIAEDPEKAQDLFAERGGVAGQLQSRTEQLLRSPASTLIELPKATTGPSPYQMINSGLMNQLTGASQNSGNLFDMFL